MIFKIRLAGMPTTQRRHPKVTYCCMPMGVLFNTHFNILGAGFDPKMKPAVSVMRQDSVGPITKLDATIDYKFCEIPWEQLKLVA